MLTNSFNITDGTATFRRCYLWWWCYLPGNPNFVGVSEVTYYHRRHLTLLIFLIDTLYLLFGGLFWRPSETTKFYCLDLMKMQ